MTFLTHDNFKIKSVKAYLHIKQMYGTVDLYLSLNIQTMKGKFYDTLKDLKDLPV